MNERPFINHLLPKIGQCKVTIHSNTIGESGYGIAVAKNSYLKHSLSQAILFLSERKLLLQLEEKWLSDVCKSDIETVEHITLHFFATPLLFIALVVCLCGAGVYVERYADRFFVTKKIQDAKENEMKRTRRLSTIWSFNEYREGYVK